MMIYRMVRRSQSIRTANTQRATAAAKKAQAARPARKAQPADALKGLIIVGMITGGVLLVNHHLADEYPNPAHQVHQVHHYPQATHLSTVGTYCWTAQTVQPTRHRQSPC